MAADRALTAERLREVVHYGPETGTFRWLVSLNPRGPVGAIAGSNRRGYRRVQIDRRVYHTHHLAWFYMTGEWPACGIDHANGRPSDNRWCNLRLAGQSLNNANARISSRNGFRGVTWDTPRRKWQAQIGVADKVIFLGRFAQPHLAYIAYCRAATKHFGEYARLYDDDVMIEHDNRGEDKRSGEEGGGR